MAIQRKVLKKGLKKRAKKTIPLGGPSRETTIEKKSRYCCPSQMSQKHGPELALESHVQIGTNLPEALFYNPRHIDRERE